jgi:hypothetical protein
MTSIPTSRSGREGLDSVAFILNAVPDSIAGYVVIGIPADGDKLLASNVPTRLGILEVLAGATADLAEQLHDESLGETDT